MTVSLKVLHAGDGYTYLLREVASDDELRPNGEALADYYVANGTPEGHWIGSGLEDMGVDGVVTEAQMKALYGERRHPNADLIEARLLAEGVGTKEALAATQLGQKFPTFKNEPDEFDGRVKAAFRVFERQHGRPPEKGVEADLVHHTVATRYLTQQSAGVPPTEPQIRAFFASRGSLERQPVAGYDIVFTPVKSVSILFGLGDRDVSNAVKGAHDRAVRETFTWLEGHASLTRMGSGGIRQVRANGFIAAAFDHFDSRAGDPNLHTHVAISGVVMGPDGQWRALDGRTLHSYMVAASERFNLLTEVYLAQVLPSVRFEDRVVRKGAQPVREVVGIDPDVVKMFSRRGQATRVEFQREVGEYEAKTGVTARPSTQAKLAQKATLATRGPKPEHQSLHEKRHGWGEQLSDQFPRSATVYRTLARLGRDARTASPVVPSGALTDAHVSQLAHLVVASLEEKRVRWHEGHVAAQASRTVRTFLDHSDASKTLRSQYPTLADAPWLADLESSGSIVDTVTQTAIGRYSICLEAPEVLERPCMQIRLDGPGRDQPTSAYRVHGKTWYSSRTVMDREDRLIAAGAVVGGPVFDRADVVAVARQQSLTESQTAVATRFASSGMLLDAAIGPAGSGKTTAMRAFARGVEINRGRVVALATQASAAKVLSNEIGTSAETLQKFVFMHDMGFITPTHALRVDANTLILVDEAGMSSTAHLDAVVRIAAQYGAGVRLLGDPEQIGSVEGGGALRLFDKIHGAERLTELHRFVNPLEAQATLAIRDGHADAAQFYIDSGRVFGGRSEDLLGRMYANWLADTREGRYSVMGAWANNDVLDLNLRAQHDRIVDGLVRPSDRVLHDGSTVGVGDRIVTRQVDRTSRYGQSEFVTNGDLWTVTAVKDNGDLKVQHDVSGAPHTLTTDYVDDYVELGYARTVHRKQGITSEVGHLLVDPDLPRSLLYVGLSRGTHENYLYVPTHELLDVEAHSPIPNSDSAAAVLRKIITTDTSDLSAWETLLNDDAAAESLRTMLPQYDDQLSEALPPPDPRQTTDMLERAFGEHAHHVDGDPRLRTLGRRLTRLEAAGLDVTETLRERVQPWELVDNPAPGDFILERLGAPGPGARTGIADVDQWLTGQEERIRTRLAHPNAGNEIPRGSDLHTLRRAWGVKLADPVPEVPAPEAHMATAQRLRDRLDAAAPQRGPGALTGAVRGLGDALGLGNVDEPRKKGKQL